jgi:hypothetical protein
MYMYSKMENGCLYPPVWSRVTLSTTMAYRGIGSSLAAQAAHQKYGPATDLTRWSLQVDEGRQVGLTMASELNPLNSSPRQVWRYLEDGEEHQNLVASRYHLGLDISEDCPG